MYKVWSSSLYFCFVLFDCQSIFFSSAYFPPHLSISLSWSLSAPCFCYSMCLSQLFITTGNLHCVICFVELPMFYSVTFSGALLLCDFLLLLTPEADLVFHRPWFWEQIILFQHFTPANICIANKILHDTAPWTKPFMRQTTCWFWPGVVWETFIF